MCKVFVLVYIQIHFSVLHCYARYLQAFFVGGEYFLHKLLQIFCLHTLDNFKTKIYYNISNNFKGRNVKL